MFLTSPFVLSWPCFKDQLHVNRGSAQPPSKKRAVKKARFQPDTGQRACGEGFRAWEGVRIMPFRSLPATHYLGASAVLSPTYDPFSGSSRRQASKEANLMPAMLDLAVAIYKE